MCRVADNAQMWSGVGGAPIDLNVDALLASLFGEECFDTIAARASELVLVNGAAPEQPVHVNVIELAGAGSELSATTIGERLAWRYPATCDAEASERIVVNVLLADWCSSGCFQTGQRGPAECFGADGCAEHGRCVRTNECTCDDGWAGPRCATRAGCDTDGCFGRGECDAESGVCACNDGFSGARCQHDDRTPPSSGGAGGDDVPEQHGATLAVDEAWLAPFSTFPSGNVTHFGLISAGQVPVRSNVEQNARTPLPQPLAAARAAAGYAAFNIDYAGAQATFNVAFTVPRHSLVTGNQPATAPVATLFTSRGIGYRDDADESGGTRLPGVWCRIPSWVDIEWEAWTLNGTLPIDAALNADLAASLGYVRIASSDVPDGAMRAQLHRVDSAYTAAISAVTGDADAKGAALITADAQRNTATFWLHYTAPLSYVERGGTLQRLATSSVVLPLPAGSIALRRIGSWPQTRIVCVLNKQFTWHAANLTDLNDAALGFSIGSLQQPVAFTGTITPA
jgi:hypothetical protein